MCDCNCMCVSDGLADCMDPDCCLQPSCQNQLYCKGSPDPVEVLSQSLSSLAPQQVRFAPMTLKSESKGQNTLWHGMMSKRCDRKLPLSVSSFPFISLRLRGLSTSAFTSWLVLSPLMLSLERVLSTGGNCVLFYFIFFSILFWHTAKSV